MASALPFLALGMMLLGGVQQASAQKQQAEASAQASIYNAQVAERNAAIVRQQAGADAKLQERDARRRIDGATAQFAGSGFDLSGSALDVLADSATQAELDNQTIKYRGELRAMGYESDAALDRFAADNARRRGQSAFTSTLFSSFGQAVGKVGLPGYSISSGLGSGTASGGTAP